MQILYPQRAFGAATYSWSFKLEGYSLGAVVRWRQRSASWEIGLSDLDGAISMGQRVVPYVDLFAKPRAGGRVPPGHLYLIGPLTDPTFEDYGDRWALFYYAPGEVYQTPALAHTVEISS